jgi:Meiotically up-regulated gene 113
LGTCANQEPTVIYFVRDELTLLVKIGFTGRDVDERLSEFQTGCPGLLTPLLQISGTRQEEHGWQQRFAAARERSEWFRPVPELMQAIEEVKASQVDTVRRVLEELRKMDNSGVSGWSMGDLEEHLRVLQVEEEGESKNGGTQ